MNEANEERLQVVNSAMKERKKGDVHCEIIASIQSSFWCGASLTVDWE